MKTVITSVGTSLISQFLKEKNDFVDFIDDMEKLRYDENYIKNNERRINNLKSKLKDFLNTNSDYSAEVSSTLKLKEKINEEVSILPVTTDTLLSNICADVISDHLLSRYNIFTDEKILIKGLQVFDERVFIKEGIPNLIDRLDKYSAQPNIYLNFTGGYKGVIPYLTLWAQVNNVKMIYLYEESNSLLEIPQAPIDINWGLFAKYYKLLLQLEDGLEISKEEFFRKNNLYNSDFPDVIEELNEDKFSFISLNSVGVIFLKKFNRFNIFFLPVNSKYFNEDPNKKLQLNRAISDLITKIDAISDKFDTYLDIDLKHARLKDNTYIFKYAHGSLQIRIHYKYQNNRLTVFNYLFVQSTSDDHEYSKIFNNEYEQLKNSELSCIPLQKEI
ncbi:hypothetical protein [Melioribacter sp. OK-6-Me]|uniref:hypothetical protein n=1 Tax=unclassified Melioribacter TaxID=2627329 RepID=UPI003ED871D0